MPCEHTSKFFYFVLYVFISFYVRAWETAYIHVNVRFRIAGIITSQKWRWRGRGKSGTQRRRIVVGGSGGVGGET